MACGCTKRNKQQFLWYDQTNPEGVEPVVYTSEIEAKAKVLRVFRKTQVQTKYIPYDPNMPIGTQIAVAEAAAKTPA